MYCAYSSSTILHTCTTTSLFAPDSEDELSSDSGSDAEGQTRPSLLPLNELIQETPDSLASLLEHLLPRLQPRAEVRGVSLEDQRNFASILVGCLLYTSPSPRD